VAVAYHPIVPKLACHACGRQIYTAAPLEALFSEERRCPRCGAMLAAERRAVDRRQRVRRVSQPGDPGPPPETGERRRAERRQGSRRGGDRNPFGP
jgi:DNA-directed RNA polymerase subunit RPC12/RpoP